MKLWGGRFEKTTDALTDCFHSSIAFDKRLYKEDIEGSIAHAQMLSRQGIISAEDGELICKTLVEILDDINNGRISFSETAEDIHMNIESILTERIGLVGKRLHTGRSRNDQVALDMRLYLKKAIVDISELVDELNSALNEIAESNKDTYMPGYTHLQRAQPVTFSYHLCAYTEMFSRDKGRLSDCKERFDYCPLGSGALAGTTYPLDRQFVSEKLGFKAPTKNTMDSVSDRDFCLEFMSAASILMMHLSRFCEEVVLWSSAEFKFIELDDAYSTGSSIMPQKKNPDMAELIRGKTGRVYGNLFGLLTVMKGLPLAYNKDMQEDKEPVFDTIDTLMLCLPVFTRMIKTAKINKSIMRKAANGGFTNATDAADWLVKKGVAFRDAHEIIGRLVLFCINNGKTLEELTLDEYRQNAPALSPDLFDDSIYDAISIETCVKNRNLS